MTGRLRTMLWCMCLLPGATLHAQGRAAWMQQARWGVMNHYLADWQARTNHLDMTPELWNRMIDAFDCNGLADQLRSVGAGYYLITLGQNSGYYLSPNATYDRLVGLQPSHCARRDLVADLYEVLHPRGIKLMVYLPSGAPGRDEVACRALQWRRGGYRNQTFQEQWQQVIAEWSQRWGDRVSGWWFDGCYWPNAMYRYDDPPNFASFVAAARAGNPNSAVAFNPGVYNRIRSLTPNEDYLAGEINDPEKVDLRRVVDGRHDGVQVHVLSYLGQRWGGGSPRFATEDVVKWTVERVRGRGAMTWDVPIQLGGLMAPEFIDQLEAVGQALSVQGIPQ